VWYNDVLTNNKGNKNEKTKRQKGSKVPFTALDKKEIALNKLYQEMVLGVNPKDKKK
jgi:hypothetical protein